MPTPSGTVFSAYAIASTIVAIQLIVLALLTGRARGKVKTYVSAEDARAFKGEKVDAEHPDVVRAQRAHMNLLESAVPFFAVGLLYAMTGASATGAAAYYYTFVGARLLHAVFYYRGMQPWRTIAFLVGVLDILGMAVHVLRASI